MNMVPVLGDAISYHDADVLRALLDHDRLARALERCWRPASGSPGQLACSIDRLHPHRDGRYILDLTVHARSQTGPILARFFAEYAPGDVRARFLRALERLSDEKRNQLDGTEAGSRLVMIEELGLVLRARGLDERIQRLGDLDRPWRLLEDCEDPTVGRDVRPPVAAELLAHRLGKRCVIRMSGGASGNRAAGRVVVKLYKRLSGQASLVAQLMRDLARLSETTGTALRTPRLRGELRTWPGHVMEDIPGGSLDDLDAGRDEEPYRLAGRLIAAFHAAPCVAPHAHGPREEGDLLRPWVELAAAVFPEHAGPIRSAHSRARELLSGCEEFEPRLIHRDFHEKQVLLHADRAVLIDFDTVAMGDPAQDLGNFLAHLDLRELSRGEDVVRAGEALLEGYGGSVVRDFTRRIRARQCATLLRLACIHAFSTRLGPLLPRLLERQPW